MVNYRYKALDSTGRHVAGEMSAASAQVVEKKLQAQKLIPVYVLAGKSTEVEKTAEKTTEKPAPFSRKKKGLSVDDVCDLMRSLAVMSNSGVSLIDSLDTLSSASTGSSTSDLVKNIKNEILGGKTLARAMQAQGSAFPDIAAEMVAVADEGGQLGKALQNTTEYLEQQSALRKSIIGALVYPGLLMGMSSMTILGFMLFILPTFGKTFEGMNVKLPMITQVLLNVGTFVQNNAMPVIIGAIVTIVGGIRLLKLKPVKAFMSRIVYKVPLAGKVAKGFALARSSATLASLTSTNIPIIRALEYATRVAMDPDLVAGYQEVIKSVENGVTIADAMGEHKCFPAMLVQLVSVGERSGRLSELVAVAASQIQGQAERKMKAALTVLEPVMIMVMGVVIGGLTLSILIPLFSLQQNIK